MMRELLANFLVPVATALILYLIRRATLALEKRAQSEELSSKLGALEHVAEASVANVEATIVKDLKDPSKPGKWDHVAAESAKNAAMDQAKDIGRMLLLELNTHGIDSAKLLGALIEKAVMRNRAAAPPQEKK